MRRAKAGDQEDETNFRFFFSFPVICYVCHWIKTEVPKRDNAVNAKKHLLNLLYEIFHISLLTKFLIAIHELTLVLTHYDYSQVTKNIPTSCFEYHRKFTGNFFLSPVNLGAGYSATTICLSLLGLQQSRNKLRLHSELLLLISH